MRKMRTMNFDLKKSMDHDLNDGMGFEEWVESASWKLWKVFEMFGWSWWDTENQPPTPLEIKEKILDHVNHILDRNLVSCESGRIRVELDREGGELSILIDMDAFFSETIEEEVDLFGDWSVG